jgi:hypothetical protein
LPSEIISENSQGIVLQSKGSSCESFSAWPVPWQWTQSLYSGVLSPRRRDIVRV